MTYNFKDALIDLGRGDIKLASNDTQKFRISICNSCPRLNLIRQCNICHCLVDGKTWLDKSSCPIDKW